MHICECIRMDTLHWCLLQSMLIYQCLNICWRKELLWRQRVMYVMSYHRYETIHTSHMNKYPWIYQDRYTPLLHAAEKGRLPVVEYLMERGANMEAKDRVSDVISLMWIHIRHTWIYVWTYQVGCTPLIIATAHGRLPVVEYLMEKGADMEAKDGVSDVISLMWRHIYVTYEYMYVNVSVWIHSIDVGCKEW